METEYKMTFSSADEMYGFANSKIFEQYCLDVNSAKTEVLENFYLDTPNGDVTSRHASVRVRKHTNVNGEIHYTFTVKISAKIENVFIRDMSGTLSQKMIPLRRRIFFFLQRARMIQMSYCLRFWMESRILILERHVQRALRELHIRSALVIASWKYVLMMVS